MIKRITFVLLVLMVILAVIPQDAQADGRRHNNGGRNNGNNRGHQSYGYGGGYGYSHYGGYPNYGFRPGLRYALRRLILGDYYMTRDERILYSVCQAGDYNACAILAQSYPYRYQYGPAPMMLPPQMPVPDYRPAPEGDRYEQPQKEAQSAASQQVFTIENVTGVQARVFAGGGILVLENGQAINSIHVPTRAQVRMRNGEWLNATIEVDAENAGNFIIVAPATR